MRKKGEIKYLAFASQKGGVGKSTLAEIFCSILHYTREENVLVVDLDVKQYSFAGLRTRDKRALEKDESLSRKVIDFLKSHNKRVYPVITSDIDKLDDTLEESLSLHADTKVVVFDMPGRADHPKYIEILKDVDCVICPIEPDIQSITSSLAYAKAVKTINGKNLYLLWNKVQKSPQVKIFMNFYNAVIGENGMQCLRTAVPYSNMLSRELSLSYNGMMRSSLLPPDKHLLRRIPLKELVNEIESKILKAIENEN